MKEVALKESDLLLKEILFCERLARVARPLLFTADYITPGSGMQREQKFSGVIESRVQLWTPPEKIDAQITVTNRFAMQFISEQSATGWKEITEIDFLATDKTITVHTFNVIARGHLKLTVPNLERALRAYEGNLLLVKSIFVEGLTQEEVKKFLKRNGYDLVVWDIVLR